MTDPRVVTDHGTYAVYKRRCRCLKCRAYQNGRNARIRAALLAALAADPQDPRHGRGTSYDAGCRCGPCKSVHKDRRADYYRETERWAA